MPVNCPPALMVTSAAACFDEWRSEMNPSSLMVLVLPLEHTAPRPGPDAPLGAKEPATRERHEPSAYGAAGMFIVVGAMWRGEVIQSRDRRAHS